MMTQCKRNRASALLTVLVITGILGISLASYLSLTSNQCRAITRSQTYNSIIPLAEAGIEEALSQINLTNNWAGNNWTLVSTLSLSNGLALTNSQYIKQRTLATGRYLVSISQTSPPTIISQAYITAPIGTNEISRTVKVTTVGSALFARGMVAKGNISWSGQIKSDSYDSQDPLYSTNGRYDPAKWKDGGSVGSVNGTITMGGGTIYGTVATGPSGSVTGGNVGTSNYISSGATPAIQPGHYNNNLNSSFPDPTVPSDWGTPSGPWTATEGQTLTLDGDYVISSIDNHVGMTVNCKARLWVQGSIAMTGQASITIGTNGSLAMYVAGPSMDLGGNGVQNGSGNALKFSVWGLSTCTSATLHGNGNFCGTLYAPEADLTMSGGGNSGSCSGAVIAKTVSQNGHFDFHYDENLGKNGPTKGWATASWDEI